MGLKRGDQILEVNGQSFEHVTHTRALEILRGTTHLSITIKSNLLGKRLKLHTSTNVIGFVMFFFCLCSFQRNARYP